MTEPSAVRQLLEREAELRFVASRYLKDGSGACFRADRCTGRSSDALAWFGVGERPEPTDDEYPADASDLAACERTFDMAPSHVKKRMLPVLQSYRLAVASETQEDQERIEIAIEVRDDRTRDAAGRE